MQVSQTPSQLTHTQHTETQDNEYVVPTEETNVTQVYNKIASEFSKIRAIHWPWIDEFMGTIREYSKILDLGCGNGRNMTYENMIFTGYDSSEEFIQICKSRGLDAVEGDMCNLPFETNSFDHIICIASFHHLITPERREKALEEMVRILKPGGKILLSVWSKTQPQKTKRVFNYGNVLVPWKSREGGRNQSYFRYYYIFKLEELEELFKSAKLKIENYVWDYGNEIFTLTYDN
tara:strand:- start:672 stop:1373 length:702 start_codon:yes stop_codon:yes gene_type:complete